MIRVALLRLSAAAALSASPAAAAQYFAQPLAKPEQARIVVRDQIWRCGEAGCQADRTGSRPAVVCGALARQVGALSSFTAEGRAFTAAELEKCNTRAR